MATRYFRSIIDQILKVVDSSHHFLIESSKTLDKLLERDNNLSSQSLKASSQLHKASNQLQKAKSQLQKAISQLQKANSQCHPMMKIKVLPQV